MRGVLQGILVMLTFLTIVSPLRYPIYVAMLENLHIDWFKLQQLLFFGFIGLAGLVVVGVFLWAFVELMSG